MKFVLYVEGRTEKDVAPPFLKRWLDPRLKSAIAVDAIELGGHGNFIRTIAQKVRSLLDRPSGDDIIGVIGLLDLYGPEFYPPDITASSERCKWGTEHIERSVARPGKFRMFFAVHEFEAWLLSQPELFPREVRAALPKKIKSPEAINFDEPPAKLLEKLYHAKTSRPYKKRVDGVKLFEKLDPAVAAEKCPQLKSMLETMLEMAKAAKL